MTAPVFLVYLPLHRAHWSLRERSLLPPPPFQHGSITVLYSPLLAGYSQSIFHNPPFILCWRSVVSLKYHTWFIAGVVGGLRRDYMVNEGYEGGIGVRQQSIVRLLEIYCLAGNDRGGGDIKGISQILMGRSDKFHRDAFKFSNHSTFVSRLIENAVHCLWITNLWKRHLCQTITCCLHIRTEPSPLFPQLLQLCSIQTRCPQWCNYLYDSENEIWS